MIEHAVLALGLEDVFGNLVILGRVFLDISFVVQFLKDRLSEDVHTLLVEPFLLLKLYLFQDAMVLEVPHIVLVTQLHPTHLVASRPSQQVNRLRPFLGFQNQWPFHLHASPFTLLMQLFLQSRIFVYQQGNQALLVTNEYLDSVVEILALVLVKDALKHVVVIGGLYGHTLDLVIGHLGPRTVDVPTHVHDLELGSVVDLPLLR